MMYAISCRTIFMKGKRRLLN